MKPHRFCFRKHGIKQMRFLLLLLALAVTGIAHNAAADIGAIGNNFGLWHEPKEVRQHSGILVPSDPIFGRATTTPWRYKNYTVTALYSYYLHARVLRKEHYWMDRESELAPYDLVLGWRTMSDSSVLEQMEITQSGRWWHYHYQWRGAAPISGTEIPLESGNMHIIPGNDDILHTLKDLASGNVVYLEGYLVRAQGSDGWNWISSVGPDSEGPHGCKLIWVTKLTVER